MSRLESKIKNIRPFNEELGGSSRRDYRRAVKHIPKLEEIIDFMNQILKDKPGYNAANRPKKPVNNNYPAENVLFNVKTESTTKKSPYKNIVMRMEDYLVGIISLLEGGRTITGIIKENGEPFMTVESLKQEYDIIVAGIFEPEIKQTITYSTAGALGKEKSLSQLIIPKKIPSPLARGGEELYIRINRILADMLEFKEKYENKLTKGLVEEEKTAQISSTQTYDIKKIKRKGPNWPYIVKTLVTVPIKKAPIGEIDKIVQLNLKQARKQFPYYNFTERKAALYISIPSVNKRIQNLKLQRPVKATVVNIKPGEIL